MYCNDKPDTVFAVITISAEYFFFNLISPFRNMETGARRIRAMALGVTHGFEKRAPAVANRRSTREKNRSSRHFRGAWNTLVNFNDPIESTMAYTPGANDDDSLLCLLIFPPTLLACIRFTFWFDWFVATARE